MKKPKRSSVLVPLTMLAIASAVVIALVFPASASTYEDRGHWVDNLGRGVTAAEFSIGNDNPVCETGPFRARSSDLWVFEVTGATDPQSIPRWDASVPAWTSPNPVVTRDVTAEYDRYLPSSTTKRLYIESTPAGARLNAAHLLYGGDSSSEVLLFTCADGLEISAKSPLVANYDMEYRWTVDANVTWQANHPYIFDISYVTNRHRAPTPTVRLGGVRVRGALKLRDPSITIASARITYRRGDDEQTCDVDTTTYSFDCTIDSRLLTASPLNGRLIGTGEVSVSVETGLGSLTRRFPIDWNTVEPSSVLNAEAKFRNHAAMNPKDEAQVSPFATTSIYQETWTPGYDYCSTNRQVFDLTTSPDVDSHPEDQLVTTIVWCRPRPGYSLQYLGGPFGVPMLIASNESLREKYPAVLAALPPLTNRDEIRNFLGSVACLDSCRALFRAQFLTAAFNALDPAFAEQVVLIDDECLTISKYLERLDAESAELDETAVTIRKSELERINGALIATCPSVSTAVGEPLISEGS